MGTELVTDCLKGMYQDVLRDPSGRVLFDSGVRNNTIVINCRRLLAAFMAHQGGVTVLGISGIYIGAGDPAWDTAVTPPAPDSLTQLEDRAPLRITNPPGAHTPGVLFSIRHLDDSNNTSTTPTRRIEISVTLPQGIPAWPDPPAHPTTTLREFGLFGRWLLPGSGQEEDVLINCVRHVAIPKDPLSTLERKIWLRF